MDNIKAAIFDFNGTMFFDSDKHEKAWSKYLGDLLGRYISDDEFKKYVHGRNSSFIIEHFTKKELSKDELMKMSDEKERVYRELCLMDKNNFHLVPGLTDFLEYLKENNILLNIATASNKENIDFYFDKFSLSKWFEYSNVVYDDGTLPGKPDPSLYLKASKNINVKPKDSVVFEDALSGIKAAYNGGFSKIILVLGKNEKRYFENIKEIDYIIKDFNDLKEYFTY